MTKLSAEAYAIVEGRHSDPFHISASIRGRQDRGCARSCPKRRRSKRSAEHGETAALARIHDAGLFAGALPNGSKRYQLRARFGENVVDLDDPYRFPPVLTDFDLYLLGEGTHQRIYDKLGAHPMTLDGVNGVAFVCSRPTRGGSRGRRLQISGIRGGIRCGCVASAIGSCSCPMPQQAIITNSISSARRASTWH